MTPRLPHPEEATGTKPRLLDLFCKAGGAARGYQRAGFYVVGVDREPQPRFAGDEFIQADALTFPLDGYWAIHASPPCQLFTAYRRRPGHVAKRPNLIPAVRERLAASGLPYIIENVAGAPLKNAVVCCGSMFGLDVRRHRYFESNVFLSTAMCRHEAQTPRFKQATNRANLRSTVEVGVWRIPLDVQQRAMGIDWMTLPELSEAIPPAYTEHLGRQIHPEYRGNFYCDCGDAFLEAFYHDTRTGWTCRNCGNSSAYNPPRRAA